MRSHASLEKKLSILNELEKVLSRKDGQRLVRRSESDASPKPLLVYVKGVSDQTIADENGVSKNIVANLRSTYLGELRDWSGAKPRNPEPPAAPLQVAGMVGDELVRELVRQVADLTKKVVSLESRINSAPLFTGAPR